MAKSDAERAEEERVEKFRSDFPWPKLQSSGQPRASNTALSSPAPNNIEVDKILSSSPVSTSLSQKDAHFESSRVIEPGPELNATTFGSAPGSQLTANTKAAHKSLPNASTAKKRGHEEVEEDDKVASEIRPAKTLKSTETISHHADASSGDNGDASMTNDVL